MNYPRVYLRLQQQKKIKHPVFKTYGKPAFTIEKYSDSKDR